MKFKFKGITSYDDENENNYTGAAKSCSITREFPSIQDAIAAVDQNKGYIINDEGDFAFHVLTIEQVK